MTSSMLQSDVTMRQSLCQGLYNSLAVQDVSPAVTYARAQAVSGLLADPQKLSSSALSYCTRALTETIMAAPLYAVSDNTVPKVLRALALVLEREDLSSTLEESTTEALETLLLTRQSKLALGETPSSEVTSTFRFATFKVVTADLATIQWSDALVSPQTFVERIHDAPVARALFHAVDVDTRKVIGLSILQYHRRHQSGGVKMNTSSVQLEANYYGTIVGGSTVTSSVMLSNNEEMQYYLNPPFESDYQCFPNTLTSYTATIACPAENF
jgi:hypothetical protein